MTKESYNFKDILHPYRGPEELPNHGLWFKLLNSITVRTLGSKTVHPAQKGFQSVEPNTVQLNMKIKMTTVQLVNGGYGKLDFNIQK